ncbi:MAG: hypothetical protein H7Z12_15190 [Rhodospirillaceae bacterium]|nr:hypothetical protein [Rhodospirillales bacterium]
MAMNPKLTAVEYSNGVTNNTAINGMFFFSGTGPKGMTCNNCNFAYSAGTKPEKAKCKKTADYDHKMASAFNPIYSACKYFERRPTPLFVTTFDKFNGVK